MSELIYTLCMLTALTCAVLLYVGYRRTRARLLFWSAACFGVMTINNLLLILDNVVLADDIDLQPWRLLSALVACMLLLYGLIHEEK